MAKTRGKIITGYAQMWPRAVFDLRKKGKLLDDIKSKLGLPGVYVLYRDDDPHYIGKTRRPLHERIYCHANIVNDKIYNFWNFFSAFEVENPSARDEIEAILIAAMPTANSANPKIHPISLPRTVIGVLAKRREIDVEKLRLMTTR
jgi:hypothetical protein